MNVTALIVRTFTEAALQRVARVLGLPLAPICGHRTAFDGGWKARQD